MQFRLTYKLRTLQKWMKDSSVPSEERKAFFINLYNCLMIDALVECSLHSDNDGQERKLPVSPLKVNTVKKIWHFLFSFFFSYNSTNVNYFSYFIQRRLEKVEETIGNQVLTMLEVLSLPWMILNMEFWEEIDLILLPAINNIFFQVIII